MRRYVPEWAKTIPTEAELAFRGKIFEVYQWPQKMFDNSYETFEMLRRADTVKIVAVLTPEETKKLGKTVSEPQIVITEQEQPRKDCFYDYPGGRMDEEDKNELEAAKREMREETGLSFRNWKLIKAEQPFNKIDWLVYTFLATGLEGHVEQQLDAGEKIEVLTLSLDEVKSLAEREEARYIRMKELSERVNLDSLEELPELYRYS